MAKSFLETVEDLKKEITKVVSEKGIYRKSSCDTNCYGWDADAHQALHKIKRDGLNGYHIESNVKFDVTDWTIVA
jgi:hypothetical protein